MTLIDQTAALPERLQALTTAFSEYMTHDEVNQAVANLAFQHPDRITMRQIGKSAMGRNILCHTIGNGPKQALLVSGLRADAPVGAMALLSLSRFLTENPEACAATGTTWHMVCCADPDGAVLNEDWFQSPYSLYQYARACYHPEAKKSIETQHIMRLIDELQPDYFCLLQNELFFGPLYEAAELSGQAQGALREAARRYGFPQEACGEAARDGLIAYASGNGRRCASLLLQPPRFQQESGETLRAMLCAAREDIQAFLTQQLDDVHALLLPDNPYATALLDGLATNRVTLHGLGHLLGAIRQAFDGAAPSASKALETAYTLADARLRMLVSAIEAASEFEAVPMGRLIAFAAECALRGSGLSGL